MSEELKLSEFDGYLPAVESAARQAAARLLQLQGEVEIREKGPSDLVSQADFESQRLIQGILSEAAPEFLFLGEEAIGDLPSVNLDALNQDTPVWVVDPLDGTMNYLHQLPGFSVSIALVVAGSPVLGVVYDPLLDEMFVAGDSQSARLNGEPIASSDCCELPKALAVASLPGKLLRESIELRRFVEVSLQCRSVRRLGSAALNLAYVASGRLDFYWATTVNAWDISAGLRLCQQGGASVSGIQTSSVELENSEFLVAATPELHQKALELIHSVDGQSA